MISDETDTLQRKRGIQPVRGISYSGVPSVEYGDDVRDEKPWQRVFYEVTRKGTHLYEPVRSVPGTLIVVLLGVYLLFGYLTQLVEDGMPRVIMDNEVTRDNFDTFSEEAAKRYLDQILGNQPRVAGTKYHLEKTVDMKNVVDTIAREATLPVHTDWQLVSGDYWLQFSTPHVNCYQNLSNIVAVLEGEAGFYPNGTIGTSLLVNCHYDSVPYAIGASDNGVFCAIMAETLSRLSKRTTKFKHNIVFLFNGAEENPLQASHGFLYHPWSKGLTNVVNLDAAGMNGKANVFQVTDPRLLAAYKRRTSKPNAQGIGEFLFASGIIPSDTDFRIWRDFGHIQGVDIAFVKWGNVYHTRYDHPDLLRAGVIQCAGDMLLGLVAELADMDQLQEKIAPTSAIYYDYLNWFLVTYSLQAAIAVDVIVALLGLLSVTYYVWLVGFRMSSVQELCLAALGRLAAMIMGFGVVAIFTLLMVATTVQMRYLSEQWIVVPLYWVPYLVGAVTTAHAFDAWRSKKSGLNRSIRTLQAMAATRLLMSVTLLVLSCISSVATLRYSITVPLFLMSVLACVSLTLVRYVRLQAWQHLLLEMLFSLPSVMFHMSLSLRLNAILLPTMGRTVTSSPDYMAALVNVGLAVLVSSTVSGIELLFSRRRLWIPVIAVSAICVIIMFIPLHPYRDDGTATQRHYWFHTDIITYDAQNRPLERTSGVLVTKHDAYTIESTLAELRASEHTLNTRRDFKEDCERYVYCNLPLYRARKDGLFIYMDGPAPFQPPPTLLVTSRSCVGELCTLQFSMNGPAHNTITIWPRTSVNLTQWTFDSPLKHTFIQNNRPVYVIIESTATYSEVFAPLEFTLSFIVPLSLQSQPIADVSHHAHKIHHPEDYTANYRALVESMPKYFNIASFMTIRSNYVV
ncbi:endoplasmic reticulum metallopeptidase 1-like [Epargyreus clarus]|uniref:endoplasmic reticulum metallopeptidase 1-like n=1 Tax=Epargyreus clarus TaxID=520877 RepID=UPI003C30AE97